MTINEYQEKAMRTDNKAFSNDSHTECRKIRKKLSRWILGRKKHTQGRIQCLKMMQEENSM